MRRKDKNIIKRKDGTFEAKYIKDIINNKIIYGYAVGNSLKEVKKKKKYSEKYELCYDCTKKPIKRKRAYYESFNSKIDDWLEYKKIKIKESSYSTYLYVVETKIRPNIGYIKTKNLNKETLNNFITLLQEQKLLSENTIHDIAIILKQILNFHKIKIDYKIPEKVQKEIIVFTKEEIKVIEKRALTYNDRYVFGIILSLYTGIRIGELCALKKENFDLKNNTMFISHTLTRVKNTNELYSQKTKIVLANPKSKTSLRLIPIPDVLKKYIRYYVLNMESDQYFLTNSKTPMEPRCYTNHYKNFLKYWGINNKKFHTTRHTFATKADETSMSTKALSELLGHSSTSITQNLYIHPTITYKRFCINNIYNKKN